MEYTKYTFRLFNGKKFFLSARWFWVIRVAQKLLETVSRFESITSGA